MCGESSTPFEFYYRLPFIAINRRFRHIGLPFVFDILYVVETSHDIVIDNYDLVKHLKYQPLVKKIRF